jgi:hypothetical protein
MFQCNFSSRMCKGCANLGTISLETLGHVSSDSFEYHFRAVWCVGAVRSNNCASSSGWALMSFTRQHHEYLNQDLTSPSTLRGEGRSNCGGQWRGSLQIEERIPLKQRRISQQVHTSIESQINSVYFFFWSVIAGEIGRGGKSAEYFYCKSTNYGFRPRRVAAFVTYMSIWTTPLEFSCVR